MQMGYVARKIGADEWQKYKKLRLEALQNDPQAFGSPYAREAGEADDYWRDKLAAEEDKSLFVGIDKAGGDFLAIGGAYAEDDSGEWNVIAIYVAPEFRGQGIGKVLLVKIIDLLKGRGDVDRVMLGVNVEQAAAVALYESCGFQVTGQREKQLLGDGNRHDEHEMMLELRTAQVDPDHNIGMNTL